MPAECSPQKSLIMLEILQAEFIQAGRIYPSLTPIITPVGINILLFAKKIIQIWIFAGDSKRVCSIVMRVSSKRETKNISGN